MCLSQHIVIVATKVVFVATKRLSRQKCACFSRDKNAHVIVATKLGINICVTGTRFSCCDGILVNGRSYMNQSKSVLLIGSGRVFVENGRGEKYPLLPQD